MHADNSSQAVLIFMIGPLTNLRHSIEANCRSIKEHHASVQIGYRECGRRIHGRVGRIPR